ncbi:MAG: MoaD/ThiS family protein [Acidimicrobiia bacterium]
MTTVRFPRLLDAATGGRRRIEVAGGTIGSVMDAVLTEIPGLRVHLFDHMGRLRPHVMCFVDGRADRLSDPDLPVTGEVRFLQAVSGG